MATEHPERAGDIAGALAVCERLEHALRDLGQSLGLERTEAEDAGLLAAAGELHLLQAHVEDLRKRLEALARSAS